MARVGYLFSQAGMSDLIGHSRGELQRELNGLDPRELLSRDFDEMCAELVQKYRLDVPVLKTDEIARRESEEVQIDVGGDRNRVFRTPGPHYMKGTAITIEVPFDGDGQLFGFGTGFGGIAVPGVVEGQAVLLAHQGLDLDAGTVKKELDGRVAQIQETLRRTREQAAPWNATEMPKMIRDCLEQRRQKLLKDQSLSSAIGYPLKKRREGASYIVPVTRKPVAIRKPTPPAAQKQEPALEIQAYNDVLAVISNMAIALERTPSVFAHMEEEDVRDFLLVMLNAIFEGQATGETFNGEGKTDILIRVEGRNIFIAECKIWDGAKALADAVDQLLGYLCWRDTKAAIIVFSRRKNFTSVLDTIAEAVKAHPACKRQLDYEGETAFRFVLRQKDDPDREITLTVMAFQVPTES